jgi:hypothetical protein
LRLSLREVFVQETHGGDDVGIWAAGPMAHLFHGTHQQTHIGGSIFIHMYIYVEIYTVWVYKDIYIIALSYLSHLYLPPLPA